MKNRMYFDYCPSCGNQLDNEWKCAKCGRDWISYAFPIWKRVIYHIKRFFEV